MKLDRVTYKNGKFYVSYRCKSGKYKGDEARVYGAIIKCKNCGVDAFSSFVNLREGNGEFCSLKCKRWGTGIKHRPDGYIRNRSDVYQHREVMEKTLGRALSRSEVVHHIDGNPSNNAPENLQLFKSQSKHKKFHAGVRK
jgi:hypothetical protein